MWLMGFRNTMLTVKKKQSDSGQTELYIFHRGKRMAEFGRRKERERAKKKNHNTHLDILRTRPAFFPSDSTIRENENNSDFHATGALPVLPITFFLPETLTRIIFGHLLVVCALLVFNRYDKTFHIPSFITHFLLSVILHIQ